MAKNPVQSCRRCKNPAESGRASCKTCLQKAVEKRKADYRRRIEEGLCTRSGCHEKRHEEFVFCEVHLRETKERISELHEVRRARGECVQCGRPHSAATAHCDDCKARRADKRRKARPCLICVDKEAAPHTSREHWTVLKLCKWCEEQANESGYCEEHEEERKEHERFLTNDRANKHRLSALKGGMCGRCHKRAIAPHSSSRCVECLAYAAQNERKRNDR